MGTAPGIRAFRIIMRAQRAAFRGDAHAQGIAVREIRAKFDEHRHVAATEEVARLAAEAEEAAEFLRLHVVQAELTEEGNYAMKLRKEHAGGVAEVPDPDRIPSKGKDLGPT